MYLRKALLASVDIDTQSNLATDSSRKCIKFLVPCPVARIFEYVGNEQRGHRLPSESVHHLCPGKL